MRVISVFISGQISCGTLSEKFCILWCEHLTLKLFEKTISIAFISSEMPLLVPIVGVGYHLYVISFINKSQS
jgi:hypothetical protein